MTVKLADSFIAIDQTGAYPRTSSRGNTYICVFYIFDPNYIKEKPIKSRHSSELLKAYREVYQWCESRGFKYFIAWTMKHPKRWRISYNHNKQTCSTRRLGATADPPRKQCKLTKRVLNQQPPRSL